MRAEKTINPKFKKQLLLLKNCAKSELDIEISVHKMFSDKHYCLTVLSELEGVGSDILNDLVTVLKHTPVYIQSTTRNIEITSKLKTTEKKSSLVVLLISFILIALIAFFVSWQNGYLNISAVNAKATQPFSEQSATIMKPLTLPSMQRTVKLRLHGSNTVGEELAPALLEAYLRSLSVTQMQWLQGDVAVERELQYIQHGKVHAIQLYAHGSSTGFQSLLNGSADSAMSSRQIKVSEIEALRATKGDLSRSGQEYIVGLDGVAVIVNKNNPIADITSEQLAQVFSGEIDNWQQLGGQNLAINLYARDKNSGTWDTFNNLLLNVHNKQLSEQSLRFESSSELSNNVSQDIAAIGFIGLPYVNNNKALAISETPESMVIYPTRFSVSTEDYLLSRRLYMYTPSSGNQMAQQFSRFVISDEGQRIVEKVGLVSQNIKLEDASVIKNAPQNYNDYAQIASRLSVNFRFTSGKNELDNKGKRDIQRLVDYLTKHRGKRVVLMGFSDSLGDPKMKTSLSLVRAKKLEKTLNRYGLNVTAVEGFGAQLPIASNKSSIGRSKNRRVEVWVF
ncbi:membrane protein [Psychromonas marina]|uniref:Membrane protein n=1 Tax=Psychromonas marina TaxID=88364 RepID=A0ABQ6DVU9_9GAMM|nr:phosphate ABC transporter substrate-binding/OmpA family protein [Psychromonas marina]GLS89154.1 membrane protein [Psychromonas marina]